MDNVNQKLLSGDFKKSLEKYSVLDQLDNILVTLALNGKANETELSKAYYSIEDDPDGATTFIAMADILYTFERGLDYLSELEYILKVGNNTPGYIFALTHKGMIYINNGGFRGEFENNIEFKRKNKLYWGWGIAFLILNFTVVIVKLIFDLINSK